MKHVFFIHSHITWLVSRGVIRQLGLPDDACVIGLLPGSRRGEIERLLRESESARRDAEESERVGQDGAGRRDERQLPLLRHHQHPAWTREMVPSDRAPVDGQTG